MFKLTGAAGPSIVLTSSGSASSSFNIHLISLLSVLDDIKNGSPFKK